jgi:hypothetical protein
MKKQTARAAILIDGAAIEISQSIKSKRENFQFYVETNPRTPPPQAFLQL